MISKKQTARLLHQVYRTDSPLNIEDCLRTTRNNLNHGRERKEKKRKKEVLNCPRRCFATFCKSIKLKTYLSNQPSTLEVHLAHIHGTVFMIGTPSGRLAITESAHRYITGGREPKEFNGVIKTDRVNPFGLIPQYIIK